VFFVFHFQVGSKQGFAANTDALTLNIDSLTVPDNIKIVGLGEASHGVSEYDPTVRQKTAQDH
jgi:erythromycin esterase-like protein